MRDKEYYVNISNKIHNNKYDYSEFLYKGYKIKGVIICQKHGRFLQNFDNHHRGKGCQKCGFEKGSKTKTKKLKEFVFKANVVHNKLYDYSKTQYVDWKTKVEIICKKHGSFFQIPNNHLRGSGCNVCRKGCRISKGEEQVYKFVRKLLCSEVIIRNDRTKIKPKELDIYIPKLKIALEFNGVYWHSDEKKGKDHRIEKTNLCKELGIDLVHVEELDWKNNTSMIKSKIESLIFNKLNNAK